MHTKEKNHLTFSDTKKEERMLEREKEKPRVTLGECHTATGKLAGAAEGLLPGRPGWAPTETQGGDTGSGVQAAGSPRSLQCCFGPRGKDQASHSTSALIPLATSSPRTKRGIRGSRRTAGKASAGNCLLVLCHAHHMTPSSLPPEKKRGGAAPHPRTRSSGRARGGSGPRGRRGSAHRIMCFL